MLFKRIHEKGTESVLTQYSDGWAHPASPAGICSESRDHCGISKAYSRISQAACRR
jgi:hypothetical protein